MKTKIINYHPSPTSGFTVSMPASCNSRQSGLAQRIACALMPQMATDAKNGNRVAQDGITHLATIAQKEIDK